MASILSSSLFTSCERPTRLDMSPSFEAKSLPNQEGGEALNINGALCLARNVGHAPFSSVMSANSSMTPRAGCSIL